MCELVTCVTARLLTYYRVLFYISLMKRFLILLLLAFTAAAASAQVRTPAKAKSLVVTDSLTTADKEVNRRFLNNGTTLLNLRGAIPEPRIVVRTRPAQRAELSDPATEKLVARNLLFTGELRDHISQPLMIYKDSLTMRDFRR